MIFRADDKRTIIMLSIGEYNLISSLDYVRKGGGVGYFISITSQNVTFKNLKFKCDQVVLVKSSRDSKEYVLKIINKHHSFNEKEIYETINEGGSPFIAKYHGAFQTRVNILLSIISLSASYQIANCFKTFDKEFLLYRDIYV